MTDMKKCVEAVIAAEYALAQARLELAHAFCDWRDPDEVHGQIAAMRAGRARLAALDRLLQSDRVM